MRIVQITDLHLDLEERTPHGIDVWENARWAVATARDARPDLVVVSGDLALHYGSPELYAALPPLFAGLGCDYLLLPGNHDDRSAFGAAFGRRYALREDTPWLDRQVDAGGVPMLLLDSSAGRLEERQLAWVDAVLTARTAAAARGAGPPGVLVWIHHPVLTGFHRYMDGAYPLQNADAVRAVLTRHRRALSIELFCGHYHCEDSRVDGIRQHTTPSTYMQIDPEPEEFRVLPGGPAIRIVDVDTAGAVETVVVYRDERFD